MNLPRRAAILTILLAHAEQAASEIERLLFERDPYRRKPLPQIPPKTAPAGFAQANAEPPPRDLAKPTAQEPAHAPQDTAAQFPPKFFTQYAAEQHLREVFQVRDGLLDLARLLKTYVELANDSRALTEPQEQASPQEPPKACELAPPPKTDDQKTDDHQAPPRPNPDNVWGAVHKLRARFGEEAAQVLIEALSGRMEAQAEKVAREEAEKIEAKRQAEAKRERITERVLRDHGATLDILDDNAKPAPTTPLFLPTTQELEDKANRLMVEHELAVMQRVLTDDILDLATAISEDRQATAAKLNEIVSKLRNVNIDFDKLLPKSPQDPTR